MRLIDGMLKPCPFCGGKALGPTDAWPHMITCEHCGAGVKGFGFDEEGMKEACAAWNKRVDAGQKNKKEDAMLNLMFNIYNSNDTDLCCAIDKVYKWWRNNRLPPKEENDDE